MHSIKLLCTTVHQPCNSLFLVGSDAGPPRCSRLAADQRVAYCAARSARICTILLTGDYEYIMPVDAGPLGTALEVSTGRAQRPRDTTQHFYRPNPVPARV